MHRAARQAKGLPCAKQQLVTPALFAKRFDLLGSQAGALPEPSPQLERDEERVLAAAQLPALGTGKLYHQDLVRVRMVVKGSRSRA